MNATLPASLSQVDPSNRLRQTIGFTAGGIATGAVLVLLGLVLKGSRDVTMLALIFAVGAACGAWEYFHRRAPFTLVSDGQGHYGLYRGDTLVKVLAQHDFGQYQLSFINTFRELMILGFMSFGGVVAALSFPGVERLIGLGAAIATVSALISSVQVRMRSKHVIMQTDAANSAVPFPKGPVIAIGIVT